VLPVTVTLAVDLQVSRGFVAADRDVRPSSRPGECPEGVAPPGSLRTRREPLDSTGSHRPAVRASTNRLRPESDGFEGIGLGQKRPHDDDLAVLDLPHLKDLRFD